MVVQPAQRINVPYTQHNLQPQNSQYIVIYAILILVIMETYHDTVFFKLTQ